MYKKKNSKATTRPKPNGRSAVGPRTESLKQSTVPSGFSTSFQKKAMKIDGIGSGNVRITHTEMVTTVFGGSEGGFSLVALYLNPGLAVPFPTLSGIAANFTAYRFRKLIYHLRPIVGTSTPGSIYAAGLFNGSGGLPFNRADLLSIDGAKSGPIWQPLDIELEPSRLHWLGGTRLVRVADLDPGSVLGEIQPYTYGPDADHSLYDAGRFLCGALNPDSGTDQAFDLFVTYTIDLLDMRRSTGLTNLQRELRLEVNTGSTPLNPFGSGTPGSRILSGRNNLAFAYGNSCVFDTPGSYRVSVLANGDTTGNAHPVLTPDLGNTMYLSGVSTGPSSGASTWHAYDFAIDVIEELTGFDMSILGWFTATCNYLNVNISEVVPEVLALLSTLVGDEKDEKSDTPRVFHRKVVGTKKPDPRRTAYFRRLKQDTSCNRPGISFHGATNTGPRLARPSFDEDYVMPAKASQGSSTPW